MRCLNSPPVLNSSEAEIVAAAPSDARHILVVNAGDGRLARALKEKSKEAAVSVVTIQPGLHRHLDDLPGASVNPWDPAWYASRVAQHGPFDLIVFVQLQDFWRGEMNQFQAIVRQAKPGALVWATFLNSQSNRMIARFVPPIRLGFSSLADPLRATINVDLASYMDLAGRLGGVTHLWGMLDQNAQEFCQKPPSQPVLWESRGIKVNVGTYADAFLWGASVVGVGFRTPGGGVPVPATPRVAFSPYHANLLQAMLLPYPDHQTQEGALGAAHVEVDGWRRKPDETVGQLVRLFLKDVPAPDQPKRVLLLGSGWGRDLVLFKKLHPTWEWVGYEHNRALAAIGEDLVKAAGASVVTGDLEDPLPFADRSFDAVLSLGYFSSLWEPAAKHLAKEARRVAKGSIHHLEDGRGPEQGMQLKSYSLKAVYAEAGVQANVQPVLVDGSPIGMYILKVPAPA